MKQVSLSCLVLLVFLVGFAAAEDKTSELKFLVIKDYNGKPIRNASVVMHPIRKDGKQDKGGLQLKTDSEGRTSFDGVPYGKLRIQVLAQGFQTFGDDYDISQPTTEITVKLKRPVEQYSIYDEKNKEQKEEKQPEPK
jgi:hypothetical protein